MRFGQGGGDVLQVDADLRQLKRLGPYRFGYPLHFGGVVDRVVAVLVVPRRVEAVASVLERVVGLRSATAGFAESLRQIGDLQRLTGLQASVDRPGVATGLSDQRVNVYVGQAHSAA